MKEICRIITEAAAVVEVIKSNEIFCFTPLAINFFQKVFVFLEGEAIMYFIENSSKLKTGLKLFMCKTVLITNYSQLGK